MNYLINQFLVRREEERNEDECSTSWYSNKRIEESKMYHKEFNLNKILKCHKHTTLLKLMEQVKDDKQAQTLKNVKIRLEDG